MSPAMIELIMTTGFRVGVKLLEDHVGKPLAEASDEELQAALAAIEILTVAELKAKRRKRR